MFVCFFLCVCKGKKKGKKGHKCTLVAVAANGKSFPMHDTYDNLYYCDELNVLLIAKNVLSQDADDRSEE